MSEPARPEQQQAPAGDPLERIAYISLPDDFDYTLADMAVDPNIALPIELEPGASEVSPDSLTWDATIAAMLKILAYHPQHRDADYYRRFVRSAKPGIKGELTEAGIIKAHNGDFAMAEELFLALIGLSPEDVAAGLNLAFAYEEHANASERGDDLEQATRLRENAEQSYRRVLELDPLHAETHLNLAHFFVTQRRYGDARPHLEVYVKHGEDEDKRTEATRLLTQIENAGLEDSSFREAYQLVRDGDEEGGLERIERFLADHTDVWQAHFLRGWALRRLGKYADARQAFQIVVRLATDAGESGLADTYNELAICNLELDDYEAADANLRSALQLEPENTKIISNMGILALKRGALNEARGYFQTILELDPNDPLASKYLDQLGA